MCALRAGANSLNYKMEYYHDQLNQESAWFDTGERDAIFIPNYDFRRKLEKLQNKIENKKFVIAIKTQKKILNDAVWVY